MPRDDVSLTRYIWVDENTAQLYSLRRPNRNYKVYVCRFKVIVDMNDEFYFLTFVTKWKGKVLLKEDKDQLSRLQQLLLQLLNFINFDFLVAFMEIQCITGRKWHDSRLCNVQRVE